MKTYSRGSKNLTQRCLAIWLMCLAATASGATFSVSPATVSNTYSGWITLQVGGLTNGETVVIQKFADVNTNGVIDTEDWLIQQYRLTDGGASVIGGVTNVNVPYDSTPANGTIVSTQSLLTAGIASHCVGDYLCKLSSPSGRFTPVTNLFTVTSSAFGQSFTGNVRCDDTNMPYAGLILFTPSSDGEGIGRPVASTVADATGAYTIQSPPGSYILCAFKSGYVANVAATPILTLGSGVTITTNVSLLPATRTISGRVVDAATNAIGLAGVLAAWSSTDGQLSVQFTDTNGNFTSSVTAGDWRFGGDDAPFVLLGYVQLKDWPAVNTTTGNVTGVTLAVPKATALFYGTVKDDQSHPLPGAALEGINADWSGTYYSAATADSNGQYVLAVNAGIWGAEVDNEDSDYASYIFSPPRSADTTFTSGQAVRQDFIALLATNYIYGWVRQTNATPIAGVAVWAEAIVNARVYQTYGLTDTSGNYVLPAANGYWSVGLNCDGGDDSLQQFGNYECPVNQTVLIANNNAVAQFTVRPPEPLRITTTTLPDGVVGVLYNQQLAASGGQSPYHWNFAGDTSSLPPGSMSLSDNGTFFGVPSAAGSYSFQVVVTDNNYSLRATQSLSLTIKAPLQITTTSLSNGTQNVPYSQQLAASGGQQPYHWYLPGGTASLPPGTLSLTDGGLLAGTPTSPGTYSFWVGVGNADWSMVNTQLLSLTIDVLLPLQVTTSWLVNGTNGVFYGQQLYAAGGKAPYTWSLSPGSASLPANLALSTNGVISGIPAGSGTTYFFVRVTDAALQTADKFLSLTINNPELQVTSSTLPVGWLGTSYSFPLQATGGQPPYTWALALGSANLPANLTLATDGTISGIPANTGTFYFIVRATDASSSSVSKSLAIVVQPKPTLTAPSRASNGQFQMRLNGVAGQDYTVEYSTTLTNWTSLFVTNNAATNSFIVVDPNATNNSRFYRVRVGP